MTSPESQTDMLAAAREAQWSANTFMGADSIKLVAPAKVNLLLDVREKRSDGYHEVANIMHSLALHDVLYMNFKTNEDADAAGFAGAVQSEGSKRYAEGSREEGSKRYAEGTSEANVEGNASTEGTTGTDQLSISLEVAIKDCGTQATEQHAHFPLGSAASDPEKNLACKAVRKLAEKLAARASSEVSANDDADARSSANDACGTSGGISGGMPSGISGSMHIRIEKHIPAQAGLGGGSTDAAAALIGAAHLWNVPESDPAIREAAAELGADVAFFLDGGCVLMTGTGERPELKLIPMKKPLVLVKPAAGVSTAQAYKLFDEAPVVLPAQLVESAENAESASEVPLANNLTQAAQAILPELEEISSWLASAQGVASDENGPQALLCGSGSTVFAIADTYADAVRVASQAQAHGWWARATTFASLPAARVR